MPTDSLRAAIAVTRFGLGGRRGEIAAASADPIGYLSAQIRPGGADQVDREGDAVGPRMAIYYDYAEKKRELKTERRQAYQQMSNSSGAATAQTGPVNKKGKSLYDVAGQRIVRPKKDAGLDRLHDLVNMDLLARLRLATATEAGFRERWAQFWINHFTVGSRKPQLAMISAAFEREAIRPHVFGRFDDMAFAVAHHPAMLLFLNQAKSVGPNSVVGQRKGAGLNENLARETLELHTLGAESGYTQADVTEFARALTGFAIARPGDAGGRAGGFSFAADAHEPGPRTIMGRRYDQPGEAQADAILRTVATDPRTAAHVSRKLAAYFVADDPPPAVVAALEQTWIRSRGDLAQVAHALVTAPAAWDPVPVKFKPPYDFLVSCFRAGGLSDDEAGLAFATLERLGQRPFDPPSPKGWPDEASAWATSESIVERLQFANLHALRIAPGVSAAEVAQEALGARTSPGLVAAMARAADRTEALTLLFMSPEFQRR